MQFRADNKVCGSQLNLKRNSGECEPKYICLKLLFALRIPFKMLELIASYVNKHWKL